MTTVTLAAERKHRTDWFCDARWGIFIHYLAAPASSSGGGEVSAAQWNAMIDAFDAEALAEQVASTGAGYLFLTLGQNSGHYCSPNATYDQLVGISPSKLSRRDLPADLSDALARRGVRMMVYLTSGAPEFEPQAVQRLGWRRNGGRLAEFQRKWEAVIREWSLRWGDRVHGWWIDGCYWPDDMYRHADEPNFNSFVAAMRAGNPNSIVALNPGVKYPIYSIDPAEDFTGGEVNQPQEIDCPGRWLGGTQFQMLSFLGNFWGVGARPRFSDAQAIEYTRSITDYGGVVSWDVPVARSGLILPPFLDQLRAIGRAVEAAREENGAAPLPAPRRVKHQLTVTQPPSPGKDGSAGVIRIRSTNLWEAEAADRLRLWIEPVSAAALSQTEFDGNLAAGAKADHTVSVRLNGSGANTTIKLQRLGDDRVFSYPLPIRQRVELPQIAQPAVENLPAVMAGIAPHAVIADGQPIAKVRLAMAGDALALVADVVDRKMMPSPAIWDGTCIEIFSADDHTHQITQLFLVPSVAAALQKAWLVTPAGPVAADEIALHSTRQRDGYELAALIPRSLLRIAPGATQFLFEISITASQAGDAFERGTLFNSPNAAGDCGAYGQMILR